MLSGLALLMRKVLPYHADRNTPSPSPKRTKMKYFSILDMFNRHQYLTHQYVEYCGYDEGISWSKPIILGIIEPDMLAENMFKKINPAEFKNCCLTLIFLIKLNSSHS